MLHRELIYGVGLGLGAAVGVLADRRPGAAPRLVRPPVPAGRLLVAGGPRGASQGGLRRRQLHALRRLRQGLPEPRVLHFATSPRAAWSPRANAPTAAAAWRCARSPVCKFDLRVAHPTGRRAGRARGVSCFRRSPMKQRVLLAAVLLGTLAGCAAMVLKTARSACARPACSMSSRPRPFGFDSPGAALTIPPLPGSGMPPMISHTVDEYLPLTAKANECLDCHDKPDRIGKPVASPARPARPGQPLRQSQRHAGPGRNAIQLHGLSRAASRDAAAGAQHFTMSRRSKRAPLNLSHA
jgi:hypothetical protein